MPHSPSLNPFTFMHGVIMMMNETTINLLKEGISLIVGAYSKFREIEENSKNEIEVSKLKDKFYIRQLEILRNNPPLENSSEKSLSPEKEKYKRKLLLKPIKISEVYVLEGDDNAET